MSRVKERIKQRNKGNSATVGLSIHYESHDADKSPPIFSLRCPQKGYYLGCCQKHKRAASADRLFGLNQMSWDEVRKSDKRGLGTGKIARSAVEAPIPKHATQGMDFITFRFCSRAPMVGCKIGTTFYALWLDREFGLYKH